MPKNKKPKMKEKTDWSFEPKLGYEVEPTITKKEFEEALTRLAKPSPKPSDLKKKGTSA